jgi:hypothetical protein
MSVCLDLDQACFFSGADYLAYPPVVAYGENANTIHYIKNLDHFQDRSQVIKLFQWFEYRILFDSGLLPVCYSRPFESWADDSKVKICLWIERSIALNDYSHHL